MMPLKIQVSIHLQKYYGGAHMAAEIITMDTVLYIKHGPEEHPPPETVHTGSTKPTSSATKHRRISSLSVGTAMAPSLPSTNALKVQVIDFSSIEKSVGHHPQDPLTDAVYFKAHRRAERKEKQLRNIEKERAMHEKVQLERLLEGLQGHDWLRVLGITGVTDSEARRYEPKRAFFIDEVQALVTKFKLWKEEERRMKLEKDAALLAKEETGEAEELVVEDSEEEIEEQSLDSSEIDASAAMQLQMEISGSVKGKARQRGQAPPPAIIYRPPTPEGPFTSFYAKPHLRAAALGKQRHGRNTTAFGAPIPDLEEREFSLPGDYTTPEAIRESARRRRRMKRESLVDSKTAL